MMRILSLLLALIVSTGFAQAAPPLTVTDDDGATANTSKNVTVTAPSGGITLTATGYKVKGTQTADLAWSGATSTNVDVYPTIRS